MKQLCPSLDRDQLFDQLYRALRRIEVLFPDNAYCGFVHLSQQTLLDMRQALNAAEEHHCDGGCEFEEMFTVDNERRELQSVNADRAADMRANS